jgi:hypothetical protein
MLSTRAKSDKGASSLDPARTCTPRNLEDDCLASEDTRAMIRSAIPNINLILKVLDNEVLRKLQSIICEKFCGTDDIFPEFSRKFLKR